MKKQRSMAFLAGALLVFARDMQLSIGAPNPRSASLLVLGIILGAAVPRPTVAQMKAVENPYFHGPGEVAPRSQWYELFLSNCSVPKYSPAEKFEELQENLNHPVIKTFQGEVILTYDGSFDVLLMTMSFSVIFLSAKLKSNDNWTPTSRNSPTKRRCWTPAVEPKWILPECAGALHVNPLSCLHGRAPRADRDIVLALRKQHMATFEIFSTLQAITLQIIDRRFVQPFVELGNRTPAIWAAGHIGGHKIF